ncbi:tail fiber domain-containing protein [Rosenbergiella metrosideri]|uniref:tail fiber domain-containing protein n=1 Tax=Rosenbergiella metrosideri TaxID=2921185 RepID=UPI001F4F6375|nr:tail fiber domain-containing protein [Rosenbergiella metrosideri]
MAGKNRPNAVTNVYEYEDVGNNSGLKLEVNYASTKNDFNFQNNGTATAVNWLSSSDSRIKDNIKVISSPLTDMVKFRGATWELKIGGGGKGIGFIAQAVQEYDSDLVTTSGTTYLEDGTLVNDTLSVNAGQIAAGLHHEAILNLMSIQRKALLALSDLSISDEDKQSALIELATLIPDESEYADQ